MPKVLKTIEIANGLRPAFEARPAVIRANVWRELSDLGVHVDNARREAETLVNQAKADAAQIRAQAREEGRIEGCARFLEALRQTQTDHAAWLERAEPEAVELALKIAERIIGDAACTDPAAMHAIVRKAALAARGRGDLELSIHPDALVQVQDFLRTFSVELGVNIRLRGDARLSPADCVVHTSAGDIDARLETQLQAIRHLLLGTP